MMARKGKEGVLYQPIVIIILKGESEGRTHIDDVRQHQRRSDYYTFSAVQTKGMHDVPTKLNNARSLNKVCVAVTALPEL